MGIAPVRQSDRLVEFTAGARGRRNLALRPARNGLQLSHPRLIAMCLAMIGNYKVWVLTCDERTSANSRRR